MKISIESEKSRNIYAEILKWANKKGKFTKHEILEEFPKQKDIISREMELGNGEEVFRLDDSSNEKNFHLTFSGAFKLIEYEELVEARRSSRWAITIAIVSVIVTLITVVISIFHVQEVKIIEGKDYCAGFSHNLCSGNLYCKVKAW